MTNIKSSMDNISKELQQHPDINKWTFSVSTNKSLEIGMMNNKIGGLHNSPGGEITQKMNLSIYWKGEKRSTHKYIGVLPEFSKSYIDNLKGQAFHDDIIPDLPNPANFKDVKVYDEAVNDKLENSSYLFENISKCREALRNISDNIDGSTGVQVDELFVRNSEGFNNSYKSSESYIHMYADSILGESKTTRKLFTNTDVEFVTNNISEYLQYYKKDAPKGTLSSGKMDVIIPYGDFIRFIGFYILSNMNAEAIDTNSSAFKLEDFKNNKQVMRSDLSLYIDNTADYESGSLKFSGIGNPAGKKAIIENGKLQTPIVNLKYSKKFGYELTPHLVSYDSLFLKNSKEAAFKDAYQSIEKGLILDGMLGLHTQDNTRGLYSLNFQSALFINDGKILGKGNVLLSGNFFDDLLREDLTLVNYPEKSFPGVKFKTEVSIID